MDQIIKDRWVAALRSGKYNQATDALKTPDGYCCLGVLCELAVQDGVIKPYSEYHAGYPYSDEDGDVNYVESVLPWPVVEWAGLDSANPVVEYDDCRVPISDPNDSGVSFSDIAQIIEEQL